MSQNGKLMPNLDQQSTKVLNLTVLQRTDPFVEEILITASHVTFYEFNIDLSQWSRKDVEGSLFVVKRNSQPRFQFIVMNRRNEDNLVENLLGDFEFEVQVPYLLYRNAAQEVNGIWFYNTRECEEVGKLFSRILSAYSKVPQKSKVSSAHSAFEELEAIPTMAVMNGPLEPPSLASSGAADLTDDPAFLNFFSTALTTGSTTNAAVIGHSNQTLGAMPPPSQLSTPFPIMQTLQASIPPPNPLMHHLHDATENSSHTTNLVKPSSFFVTPSSSSWMMQPVPSLSSAPLNPPVYPQRTYGTPLLQPFPPPTPPPSLAPAPGSAPTPYYVPTISKDKVRDALLVLVQDDQFIDMVYRALLNAHP